MFTPSAWPSSALLASVVVISTLLASLTASIFNSVAVSVALVSMATVSLPLTPFSVPVMVVIAALLMASSPLPPVTFCAAAPSVKLLPPLAS